MWEHVAITASRINTDRLRVDGGYIYRDWCWFTDDKIIHQMLFVPDVKPSNTQLMGPG